MLDLGIGMGPRDDVDPGLAARARSTIWPASKAFGMARMSRRAPAALAAAKTSALAALPMTLSTPSARRLRDRLVGILDHKEGDVLLPERLADEASHPAVADQDRVVGELGRRRSVLVGFSRRGRRRRGRQRADFGRRPERLGFGRQGLRVALFEQRLQPADACKDQRVEHDRQDRAGEDQVAPLLGEQVQADAELGENEGELADLREARRNRQRRADGMAESHDDQECRRPTCR